MYLISILSAIVSLIIIWLKIKLNLIQISDNNDIIFYSTYWTYCINIKCHIQPI